MFTRLFLTGISGKEIGEFVLDHMNFVVERLLCLLPP